MNLSDSPGRPACPSRASGWSSLTTPWGLPCCVRFPCVHAVATAPAQRLGAPSLIHPAVSAFPERVTGSDCASSVSRFARRSLTLRPAHSRCHRIPWPASRRLQPFRYLHDCSGCFRLEHFARWDSHPLESAAFARRTPTRAVRAPEQRMAVHGRPRFAKLSVGDDS